MKVLAIRTRDGHYLEFATIRANLDDGSEIAVDLSQAVFVEILEVGVPEPLRQFDDCKGPVPHAINGAGGIKSEEVVKGIG
jgi:hypothetical protein